MPTPYDEEQVADTARIRELNDVFRCDPNPIGAQLLLGKLVVTRGVAARGNDFVDRAVRAVHEYADFTEHNDPHGEHDFGRFTLDDAELLWKIDLYEATGVKTSIHTGAHNLRIRQKSWISLAPRSQLAKQRVQPSGDCFR